MLIGFHGVRAVKCWEATSVCWLNAASLDYDCLMVFYKDTWQHLVNSKSMSRHLKKPGCEKYQTSMEFTLKSVHYNSSIIVKYLRSHLHFSMSVSVHIIPSLRNDVVLQMKIVSKMSENGRTSASTSPLPDWNWIKITPPHNSATHVNHTVTPIHCSTERVMTRPDQSELGPL